jgi:hypothetical protein
MSFHRETRLRRFEVEIGLGTMAQRHKKYGSESSHEVPTRHRVFMGQIPPKESR